jgi:F-type H+-transporting ATPase subunit b
MLIDWFTVGAQLLNFVILVWLLKRFLYGPIVSAIDAREKRIAAELADAAAKQLEANQVRAAFADKSKALDEQCSALLETAVAAAKTERERLLNEARESAATLRITQGEAMQREQQNLSSAITRLARDEVFAIARKTLTDLATSDLEERMGAILTRRLHELDASSKMTLRTAIGNSAAPLLVRSSFALPPGECATIQNALNEVFATEVRIRFEAAPAVICGIELSVNGQKLGWSIAEYLDTLEQRVGALLDAQTSAPVRTVRAEAAGAQAVTT